METLSRSEAVHPVLLPVVPLISRSVASSVPRLKADERRNLSWRRPYAHYRSIECHLQPRSPVGTIHCDLIDLAVLKHDGVDCIECVCSDRQKAVCWQLKRIFCLRIHAALLLDADALKRICLAETEESTLSLLKRIVWVIECRMSTDLEIDLLIRRISHIPDHIHLVSMELVSNLKGKRIWIFCESLL